MATLDASTLDRLRRLDSSILSDADKGLPVLDPQVRLVQPRPLKLAGPAFTVAAHDDLLPMVEALSRAEAGDVLMVETAGGTRAVSGEIFIKEAVRLRLGGVVIDGFVRDLATLRELDVPVFARGATPRAAPSRQSDPQVQLPVRVGGVDVRPGDLVLGDLDGVVVAPPERALAALETAEAIQAKEGAVLAGLDEGFTLLDGLTYREHLARLRAGEESALQFRDPRTG